MRRVHVRRGGSLLLLSVLAACGGGGAGGGVPLPTIPAGPYHSVSFKGIHGAPDTVRTNVGTIVSNGTDALTDAGSTQNQNGVISADPGGPVVRYSVSLSGDLSLKDDLGTEHFRGGMILGGEMAGVTARQVSSKSRMVALSIVPARYMPAAAL